MTAQREEPEHPAPRPGHWVTSCLWHGKAPRVGPALGSGGLGQADWVGTETPAPTWARAPPGGVVRPPI